MVIQRLRKITLGQLRPYAPALTLVLLVAVVGSISPKFLSPQTLIVLAADTATLFILAAGITFVIMLGSIDLSVQAVASLTGVVLALTLPDLGYLSIVAAIGVGALAGIVSGFIHVGLRIPSFIVTLAAGGVVASIALVISKARAISISADGRQLLNIITGTTLGLPNEVIIAGLVLVAGLLLQRFTAFGRYSSAIGAGETATFASGVNVNLHKVAAFALSGGLAGLAGVILAARLASGSPTLANEFLLPAIAAVLVGGTAITGGVGSVGRTVIGALIISVVRIGMTFIGVDIFAQQIVFGLLLILAVGVTIDRSKIPIVK